MVQLVDCLVHCWIHFHLAVVRFFWDYFGITLNSLPYHRRIFKEVKDNEALGWFTVRLVDCLIHC